MIDLGFKMMKLNTCEPCNLIRFQSDSGAQWAIVGQNNARAEFWPVCILTGENAPLCVNAIHNGQLVDLFSDAPVANYADHYQVLPDYKSTFEIAVEPAGLKSGSLIVSDDEIGIRVAVYRQTGQKFFSLGDGTLKGDRGGYLATFGSWRIVLPNALPSDTSYEVANFE